MTPYDIFREYIIWFLNTFCSLNQRLYFTILMIFDIFCLIIVLKFASLEMISKEAIILNILCEVFSLFSAKSWSRHN